MQHQHFHSSATGRRSADTTKCCGFDGDATVDDSHFCTLLCGTMYVPLVALPTSTINASPNFGPLLQNVIWVTNTLTFVRRDVFLILYRPKQPNLHSWLTFVKLVFRGNGSFLSNLSALQSVDNIMTFALKELKNDGMGIIIGTFDNYIYSEQRFGELVKHYRCLYLAKPPSTNLIILHLASVKWRHPPRSLVLLYQ